MIKTAFIISLLLVIILASSCDRKDYSFDIAGTLLDDCDNQNPVAGATIEYQFRV